MNWFRSRRGLAALLGILLLAMFAVRPGVGRLRTRIANSISNSLGRRVEMSSARLRFLPQPGFDLVNFIVYDDPAFSLEPMLRSDEVTASLRITSLLRGRLEISRLRLGEPSLNLVRNRGGHWNLEYLLERAARSPVAPTGKSAGESRPEFPYIEASGGRINFKLGMEKKQFALTDADFALFQDSENSWGLRMDAKPVRTDSNLSDSGRLKIDGSWQRAQSLHETPLRFSMQWDQAQLGQATKLIYGSDKGWRGTGSLSAEISGTPSNLAILAEGSVEDFRRYDILAGSPMRLRTQCGAHYSSVTQTVSNIICTSPVGDGAITMHGNVTAFEPPTYRLAVFAQDVPLQALIQLARHAKKDIPNDLLAGGTLDGSVKLQRENAGSAKTEWEGSGETSEFRLASQLAPSELFLPKIHFKITSGENNDISHQKGRPATRFPGPNIEEPRVILSPFNVALGEPLAATVGGWFSHSGYNLTLNGNARLERLLRAARVVGIAAPQPDADGKVKVGLKMAGTWTGFAAPRVTGSAELHSVRARIAGLNFPIEIGEAALLLDSEKVNVQSLTASAAGATWHGSLELPRPCGVAGTCPIRMDLHADEIATDQLDKLLDPRRPWYGFLMPPQKNSYLLGLRATGTLAADRFSIRKLSATRFSASFDLDRGKLQLSNLRASVFGGMQSGEWTLDFAARPPVYSGQGSFQHVALAQLAGAMHGNCISGTATATYQVTASGPSAAEIFSSATGILKVEGRDGSMPQLASPSFVGPLQMRRFVGNLVLQHGEINFEDAKLAANGGVYDVTGTATLERALNLKLMRAGSREVNITGSLDAPVISSSPAPETQAALKR
ncbi:MAG: AsmA family protein [Terriglobales bacterium]